MLSYTCFSESISWVICVKLFPRASLESDDPSVTLKSVSKSSTIFFCTNDSRRYGTEALPAISCDCMFSNHSPLHNVSSRCFFSAVDCSIPESASIIAWSS